MLSHIGSFADIRGGHAYPSLIRKGPLRVFLQDGENDLDNEYGNWWLANLQMAAALRYRGCDYRFVGGLGAHDGVHGGTILPDSGRGRDGTITVCPTHQTLLQQIHQPCGVVPVEYPDLLPLSPID